VSAKPLVFVCYAHADERLVRPLLRVKGRPFYERCFFAPDSLDPGDVFPAHIERALADCETFHLFWSRAAAASDWVRREYEAALARWRELREPDGFFFVYRLDDAAVPFAIEERIRTLDVALVFDAGRPEWVSTHRLPRTGRDLFGRDDELDDLDAAWDRPDVHVVSFVAWGGVGKSALVNRWLARLARRGYRGAQRVLGWSFYRSSPSRSRTWLRRWTACESPGNGTSSPAASSPARTTTSPTPTSPRPAATSPRPAAWSPAAACACSSPSWSGWRPASRRPSRRPPRPAPAQAS